MTQGQSGGWDKYALVCLFVPDLAPREGKVNNSKSVSFMHCYIRSLEEDLAHSRASINIYGMKTSIEKK